jgi:hypothetical protein
LPTVRRIAANDSFVPYGVDATDASRTAFAVGDRDGRLRLVDGDTLAERCAWFTADGEPFALVPRAGHDGCEIIHLDRRDGRPLERATVRTEPAGANAIHHWATAASSSSTAAGRTRSCSTSIRPASWC